MTFAEKLDFLMNITKTTNSALASRVALDASYISRLRVGKRLIPKDEGVIRSMAAFLSRHCTEEYQQKAVRDALRLQSFPADGAKLSEELARWLLNETDASVRVERFLGGLSGMAGKPGPQRQPEHEGVALPQDAISVYYGVQGKRRAAEYFLSEVAAREKPQTLLLFSDEGTSWMTEDPVFARRWAELMVRVLSRGNRIKIIHTISRDLDEMLSAISQWMPLYMLGAIEPYFYPKKRDGVFKRTLFIAPETAALISNSVGEQLHSAANVLYRDRAAIASFAEEFAQYLHLCRPLMRIYRAADYEAYFDTLKEFERERADTLLKTESLSLLTMPEELLDSIIRRAGMDGKRLHTLHAIRIQSFQESLESNQFTEIVALPDIETVRSGGVRVVMSDMLGVGAVHYTADEYIRHLEHMIELLDAYENYHVCLVSRIAEKRYLVYAKAELGIIVGKTSQPSMVLAMSEGNMTAAFWDFLKDMVGEKAYNAADKEATIGHLREYLHKLRTEIQV